MPQLSVHKHISISFLTNEILEKYFLSREGCYNSSDDTRDIIRKVTAIHL